MPKDPAFLFYPGDWQLGTMHLTLLEKGCYMELLILQFAKGKFTEAQARHMLNGSFDVAWPNLVEKFDTDGKFYWNRRLMSEKEKRQKFTESRRNNGSIKKTIGNGVEHMPKHMETKDENVNSRVVVFNVEEEVLKNEIEFERICMAGGKSKEPAKESLRKYHLFLQEREQYPKTRQALFAGFEKWLLNEKTFNKNVRSEKNSRSVGRDEVNDKL